MVLNDISDRWVSTFLSTRDPDQTVVEAQFVASFVQPGSRILDVACGYGRHAAVLAAFGYHVTGVDRDTRMLSRARALCRVVQADMRRLPFRSSTFDAATILWQSFGYFDAEENLAVLRDLCGIVRPGGILILDLYNRDYFETRTRTREFVRAGTNVRETIMVESGRLRVHLQYDGGTESDVFDWQIYSQDALHDLARRAGWVPAAACRDFDPSKSPDPGAPLVQYVLQRPV